MSFTMQNYNNYFISQTINLKKCKKSLFRKVELAKWHKLSVFSVRILGKPSFADAFALFEDLADTPE